MSEIFQCGDNAALVGYLYDECETNEHAAIAAHLRVCAACAAELEALGSTRVQLAAWSPPEIKLGFVISQRPSAAPLNARPQTNTRWAPARWFAMPVPAWAQVAAATLIFAIGLLLGVARGTSNVGRPAEMAAATAQPRTSAAVSSTELNALERRLRDEIATIRVANQAVAQPSSPSGSEAQLMTRVRALIEESEQRQQRELAFRTAQIVRDFDSQRRVDLAQIQRNFGQIEGLTGAEVREQRELLNYLMRVSQQR
jgi:anti-sigma factor RsiW